MTDADLKKPLELYASAKAAEDAGIEMGLSAVLRARNSCSASNAILRGAASGVYRSATSSWRRGCRSSSGAAFPTTS